MNPQKRMRGWSWLLLAMFGLAAGCNGGDGARCDEICDKIVGCDPEEEDREDCLVHCGIYEDILQSGVFNSAADCILNATCEALDSDVCLESAGEEVPDSVVDGFIEAVCTKIVEDDCDDFENVEDCVDEIENDEDSEEIIFTLKMLKQSVRDCIQNCFTNLSCDDIEEDGFEDCCLDCGIPLEDDD